MDDWYSSKHKDYQQFAKKYTINKKLETQDQKIKAMRDWCDKEEVSYTPMLFINGYQSPQEYSIYDMTEVLK